MRLASSNMSSSRQARGAEHRVQVDGTAKYDRVGTLIQPEKCREGHSLATVTGFWNGTFLQWPCPECEKAGVEDPVYRLRRPIGSLT